MQPAKRIKGISEAIDLLAKAMRNDPEYLLGWQANLAMVVSDNIKGGLEYVERNKISDAILSHCFGVKPGKIGDS